MDPRTLASQYIRTSEPGESNGKLAWYDVYVHAVRSGRERLPKVT